MQLYITWLVWKFIMLCKGSGLNCPYRWHASYGLIISDDWDRGSLPKDIQRWFVLTFEVSTRIAIKSINNNTKYYIDRIYRLQPNTRWISMNYCIVSEWSDFRSKNTKQLQRWLIPWPLNWQRKCHEIPYFFLVFLWFFIHFPDFPMVYHQFSWFSYGFWAICPLFRFSSLFLVFLWISYG